MICKPLLSLLQFAVPSDILFRVFIIRSCPFGQIVTILTRFFQPIHIRPLILLKSFIDKRMLETVNVTTKMRVIYGYPLPIVHLRSCTRSLTRIL